MTYKKFFTALGLFGLFVFAFAPAVSASPIVDHIAVSPTSNTIQAGDQVTWTVTAHYSDGTTSDVTSSTTFDIPTKAGGALSGATYTSQYVGMWQIPVSLGSLKTTAYLNVVHGSPDTLLISPDTVSAKAGDTIEFHTTLEDAFGNTWDATGQTIFSTTQKNGDLINNFYTLAKTGSYVVTAKIAGMSISVPVSVLPGEPATILLSPSHDFNLKIGGIQKISTNLYDAYGNEITDLQTGLTLKGDAAILTSEGNLKGAKEGTAKLHASYDSLDTTTTVTVTKASEATTQEEGKVLGETVHASDNNQDTNQDTNTSKESVTAPIEENQSTESTETPKAVECNPIDLWVAIVILIGYALILFGYYLLIKRDEDKSWWIFPVLLTAIGIIIWTKYFCGGAYPWWPWILVLAGVALTWYGRGPMRQTQHKDVPPGTPPTDGQTPIF